MASPSESSTMTVRLVAAILLALTAGCGSDDGKSPAPRKGAAEIALDQLNQRRQQLEDELIKARVAARREEINFAHQCRKLGHDPVKLLTSFPSNVAGTDPLFGVSQ